MFTIPNQSSVAMAYKEFDEAGRMLPSSYYDRIVDVMEELVRLTVLLRAHADQPVNRYSERKDRNEPIATAVEERVWRTADEKVIGRPLYRVVAKAATPLLARLSRLQASLRARPLHFAGVSLDDSDRQQP